MAESLARPTRESGRSIYELGIAVALSLLLALFNLAPWPQGGQISLDMLPILLLARWRGWRAGTLAGVSYGLLHLLQEPVLLHPLQVLLDYPLAYGALGLAGLPALRGHIYPALTLALGARFSCHFLSGLIFLPLFLPSENLPANPFLWSLAYNGSFLLLPGALMFFLVPPLSQALEAHLS